MVAKSTRENAQGRIYSNHYLFLHSLHLYYAVVGLGMVMATSDGWAHGGGLDNLMCKSSNDGGSMTCVHGGGRQIHDVSSTWRRSLNFKQWAADLHGSSEIRSDGLWWVPDDVDPSSTTTY